MTSQHKTHHRALGHSDAQHFSKENRGFTLIELSIVILISGMLLAAIFSVLNKRNVLDGSTMDKKFDRALTGIAEFYRITGRYPCPADPTLPFSDSDFGLERSSCGSSGVEEGMLPVRTLNMYLGCSDRDLLSVVHRERISKRLHTVKQIINHDKASDNAKYGVVTAQDDLVLSVGDMNDNYSSRNSICLNDDDAIDVFGSRLTYAVTKDSTSLSTIEKDGRIDVVDEGNNPASRAPVHFILVSHGADQKGARLRGAEISGFTCDDGAQDVENCDGDDTFRIMPTALHTSTGSTDHFDDRVEFSLVGYMKETDIWKMKNNEDTMVLGPTSNGAARGLVIGTPTANMLNDGPLRSDDRLKIIGGDMKSEGGNFYTGIDVLPKDVGFTPGKNTVSLRKTYADDTSRATAAGDIKIFQISPGGRVEVTGFTLVDLDGLSDRNDKREVFDIMFATKIPANTESIHIYYDNSGGVDAGKIDRFKEITDFSAGDTELILSQPPKDGDKDNLMIFRNDTLVPSSEFNLIEDPAGAKRIIEFTSSIPAGTADIEILHNTSESNLIADGTDIETDGNASAPKFCYNDPSSLCGPPTP